ncbi:UDP-N-acetyl-D-glucosamine dehydrogenase, partial [Chloroflexota bacterium]
EIQLSGDTLSSVELAEECLSSADCVLIATDHSCYDLEKIVTSSKLVFDARGVTFSFKQDNIVRLGE